MNRNHLLEEYLRRLKLLTMAREYAKVAKEAASENKTYEEFLLVLAEQEAFSREQNAIRRAIKRAGFPSIKTLDEFDFTAAALINMLNEAHSEKRFLSLEKQLRKVGLLIVDELGYIPLTKTGAHLLFEIFAERYERGSMLVTTNLEFGEWVQVFGDEKLTAALLDRLTHRCHVLVMNAESYRFKESQRRLKEEVA